MERESVERERENFKKGEHQNSVGYFKGEQVSIVGEEMVPDSLAGTEKRHKTLKW